MILYYKIFRYKRYNLLWPIRFNPSFLCQWLHPGNLLVCLLSNCPNHNNHNNNNKNITQQQQKCNIFHIQRNFTQYPMKQIYYPLLKSAKSIKYKLKQIYTNGNYSHRQYEHIKLPMQSPQIEQIINSHSHSQPTIQPQPIQNIINVININVNDKVVTKSQRLTDFLYFADQLIDCFVRNFSEVNRISFNEIPNRLNNRFPEIREIYWSKCRFLRYKFTENVKYIRLKTEHEDIVHGLVVVVFIIYHVKKLYIKMQRIYLKIKIQMGNY